MSKEQLEELQLKRYYRAKELSKLLGIGLSTVWLYAKQGKLTVKKLSSRVSVFDIQEVNKVFNLNSVGA